MQTFQRLLDYLERVKTHYQRRPFNRGSSEVIYTWQRGEYSLPFTGGMMWLFDQLKNAYQAHTEGVKETDRSDMMVEIESFLHEDSIKCRPSGEGKPLTIRLQTWQMGRNTFKEDSYDKTRLVITGDDADVTQAFLLVGQIVTQFADKPEYVVDKLWVGYGSKPNHAIEIGDWFKPDWQLPIDHRLDLSEQQIEEGKLHTCILEDRQERLRKYMDQDFRQALKASRAAGKFGIGPAATKWINAAKDYLVGSRDPEYDGPRKGDVRNFLAAINGSVPKKARLNWKEFQYLEKFIMANPPEERVGTALAFFNSHRLYGVNGLEELEAISHREYDRREKSRQLAAAQSGRIKEKSKPTLDSLEHEDVSGADMSDNDFLEEESI